MSVKLPIGLKGGKAVLITENIPNGIACKCICPACSAPLIAYKNGTRKTQYFGHKPRSKCKFPQQAIQTALHYAGKEILERARRIKTPLVYFEDLNKSVDPLNKSKVLRKECWIDIHSVVLEQKDGDIVPDIVLLCKDNWGNLRKLYVEIAVTHFVTKDQIKYQKVLDRKLPMIEIDLSSFKKNWNWEQIEDVIISSTEGKYWIYNPIEAKHREAVILKRKEEEETRAIYVARQIKIAEEKFNYYSENSSANLFKLSDLPQRCPLRHATMDELMENDKIANDPLLRDIMYTEDWNGLIYRTKFGNRRWIEYKGEKIMVYPSDELYTRIQDYRIRLEALQLMSKTLFQDYLFNCNGCPHSVDYFGHQSQHYEVCGFNSTVK